MHPSLPVSHRHRNCSRISSWPELIFPSIKVPPYTKVIPTEKHRPEIGRSTLASLLLHRPERKKVLTLACMLKFPVLQYRTSPSVLPYHSSSHPLANLTHSRTQHATNLCLWCVSSRHRRPCYHVWSAGVWAASACTTSGRLAKKVLWASPGGRVLVI